MSWENRLFKFALPIIAIIVMLMGVVSCSVVMGGCVKEINERGLKQFFERIWEGPE